MHPLILPIALLSLASSAFAGERYVEVWNPPEARTVPARPGAQKKTGHKVAARKSPQTIAKKVTDPAAANTVRATPPASAPVKVRPLDPNTDIPRKIAPDGHVLRVRDGQSRHAVSQLV
ncbi:hypothetical protein [Paraburkholderia sp. BL10I2N1]|uniref:hypothetical protein n=1 Tax=Paraburkholderia sp. BL10I2N1 TaxID=1938796 RepID=UPI0010E77C00|nr:hypothetical protein [Paraburkholderia sp. BL10I2N1]TDN61099.1 hypothetical protein B0G77_4518 [Paraburkholderia sp. BL10I2N1]